MSALLAGIVGLPPLVVLALVFLLPALEASAFVGVVVPGEIGVVLGGVVAHQGGLPLAAVVAAGIAGAVVGDSVGFAVGRRWGARLLRALPPRLVRPEHVARTERALGRLGGRAVFVGRFTAALRALVPGLAGVGGMPYGTFLLWNVLGGAVWATGFAVLGFLAGSSYERLVHRADLAGAVLLAVVAGVLLLRGLRSRRARRGTCEAPAQSSGASELASVTPSA